MTRPSAAKAFPLLFLTLFLVLGWGDVASSQPPLKVGALIPFSGRWGEAGRECAKGMVDAGRSINQRGGIYGRRLEIFIIDDTSQVAETMAAFRKLNESDRVLLLYVYSTETGLALMPHSQYHRLPTIVSSLPYPWTNPVKHPYAFCLTPTPFDVMKIAMKFLAEESGIKGRKPKVILLGSSDPISQDGLKEAKEFGRGLGLDLGPDIWLPETSLSLDSLTKGSSAPFPLLLQYNPDFTFVSLSPRETHFLLGKAKELGLKTKWICNMRAFDETLSSFDGTFGVQPIAPYGEDVPGMTGVNEAHQRWHPYDSHTLSYVEGWASVRVIAEALGRALPEQRLSREWVKTMLEGFRDFVVDGLLPPLTITPRDHRPSLESRVFVVRGGKLTRHTSFVSLEREKR